MTTRLPQLLLLLALWLCACDEGGAPGLEARADAPTSAEAQRDALREAAERAAERQDWARAEAALEALSRLDPDDLELRRALEDARDHRRVRRVMEATAALLDAGAVRSARARLRMIDGATLSSGEREQRQQLEAWIESLEAKRPKP